MKPIVFISVLAFSAVTAFGVSEGFAFQETEIVVTEQPLVSGSIKKSKSEFNIPKSVASTKDERTTIRIPGFGVIGTMPKLDFGLELLYSDEEDASVIRQSDVDELSIKGRLKRKF